MKNNPISVCLISGTAISILIAMIFQPDMVYAYQNIDSFIGSVVMFLFQIICFVFFGMFICCILAFLHWFLNEKYMDGRKNGNIWTLLAAAATAAVFLLLIH